MRAQLVREFLDRWRVWAVVAWIVLAAVVVWGFVLTSRLNANIAETRRASRANSNAVAFLCDSNAILEALAAQTATLLESEQLQQPTIPRAIAISVFRGYVEVLQNRAPCIRADRAALP